MMAFINTILKRIMRVICLNQIDMILDIQDELIARDFMLNASVCTVLCYLTMVSIFTFGFLKNPSFWISVLYEFLVKDKKDSE